MQRKENKNTRWQSLYIIYKRKSDFISPVLEIFLLIACLLGMPTFLRIPSQLPYPVPLQLPKSLQTFPTHYSSASKRGNRKQVSQSSTHLPPQLLCCPGLSANESQRETGPNREKEGGCSEKLLDSCGSIQVGRKPKKEAKQKQGTDLNSPQSKGPLIYKTLYNLLWAFLYLLHLIFRKTL